METNFFQPVYNVRPIELTRALFYWVKFNYAAKWLSKTDRLKSPTREIESYLLNCCAFYVGPMFREVCRTKQGTELVPGEILTRHRISVGDF